MSTLSYFLASIKKVKWFAQAGELPSGCLLVDTREAARAAAREATRGSTSRSVWDTARYAAQIAARVADAQKTGKKTACSDAWFVAWNAAAKVAAKVAAKAAHDAARDAAFLAGCIAVWDDPTEVNTVYALRRWSVWTAGFGLLCDIKGTLYCYRRVA